MRNNTVETLIAALVIAVAAGFLFFAYNSTHSGEFRTYDVQASLGSVDGIVTGADVRLNGIKIGTVTSIAMDPKTYRPVAQLALRDDIHFSSDSTARIASGILNGNPYLSIQPGRNGTKLVDGSQWKAN